MVAYFPRLRFHPIRSARLTLSSIFSRPRGRSRTLTQHWRIPLGFLCGGILLALARPSMESLVLGTGVALPGLALRAWAAGHIRKNARLAVSGPYAYTRNPLYVGSLFLGVGFALATGLWWLGLLFAGLYLGIYLRVVNDEARYLEKKFGEDYREWARSVPLLVPRLLPYRGRLSDGNPFSLKLYRRNREYQAALGFAAALAVLAAKILLRV